MSLANSGEYIGNCKFCKDHLSLNYISCFKTSHETDFYFCSLGHYWTVKDTSEQPQTITNVDSSDLNKVESYQDKPFNSNRDRPPFNRDRDRPPFNRDRDRPPFNRDRDRPPFNRDRDRPPFNRDKPPFNRDRPFNRDKPPFNRDKKEGFYKQFTSNKKGKRKKE
ncbi:MAG: hypothetical protein QOK67_09655 [Nitrososphaeraceae archaeon]|nr:hypothetical protein [Nitrososphaeraceae archaeon]